MEVLIKKPDQIAPVPRHPLAVEQDKASFSLALLHMAERALWNMALAAARN